MYNRYVPQNDGTYARKSIPERDLPQKEPIQSKPPPVSSVPCSGCLHPSVPQPRPCRQTASPRAASFLKQLFPKDFATEDLMIVLLLLLMAADSPENQNSALLTLALYLFL